MSGARRGALRAAARAVCLAVLWVVSWPAIASCQGYRAESNGTVGEGLTANAAIAPWPAAFCGGVEPAGYCSYPHSEELISTTDIGNGNLRKTWRIRWCTIGSEPCSQGTGWNDYGNLSISTSNATITNCGADQCAGKAGQLTQRNLTIGWSRIDANAEALIPSLYETPGWADGGIDNAVALVGTTQCDGACSYVVGNPKMAWHAQEPAPETGLYRLSVTYEATWTGSQCSDVSDPANPASPSPPCDGAFGTINGKPICVQQPGAPADPTIQHPAAKLGNPAAGGDGTSPLGSAGEGPGGAGGGPGRGSDGDLRGSSGAHGTPGGTGGRGEDPQGKDPCGLPDTPKCKLDESGTPDGSGAYTGAQSALDQYGQDATAMVEAAAAEDRDVDWSLGFSLPSSCSAIELPAFAPYVEAVDVCAYQPMIHDLMSLVWIAATIFGCAGFVHRAATGG